MRPERPGPVATARGLSDRLWTLMEACWQSDWRRRPRIPAVLEELESARAHFDPTLEVAGHAPAPPEEYESEGSSDDDERRPFRPGKIQ